MSTTGTVGQRVIQKGAKFDLLIAEDVGVWRTPCPVFLEEVAEDTVPVFRRETDGLQLDVETFTDIARVTQVLFSGAVAGIVVVVPVLHEDGGHMMSGLFEQQRRDRGIHTSGQPECDSFHGLAQCSSRIIRCATDRPAGGLAAEGLSDIREYRKRVADAREVVLDRFQHQWTAQHFGLSADLVDTKP